jgi:hypothetical protein
MDKKPRVDVIQTIEHYIEEQNGVWMNTLSLPVYTAETLKIWVSNDGNRVQLHHAKKPFGIHSTYWKTSPEVVRVLILDPGIGGTLPHWTEVDNWKVKTMEYLKKHEIEEIL